MSSQDASISFEEITKHLDMSTFAVEGYQNLLPKLLYGVLETDSSVQVKLESIQFITLNILPEISLNDVNEEIFCFLMPAVCDLVQSTLQCICELINSSDENSLQFLDLWKTQLQVIFDLLQATNLILQYIINHNKIEYTKVSNVPLCLGSALFMIFSHFKKSDSSYKKYVTVLNEILILFRKAQSIYMNLLNVVENHLIFNYAVSEHILHLLKFIEMIGSISMELAGVNVKTMVDSWKCYVNLLQKNEEIMNKNDVNVNQPIQFVLLEIEKNFESETDDMKTVTQSLKILNFLLKIVVKISEIFRRGLQKCLSDLLQLCFTVYKYGGMPYLKFKDCPNNVMELINAHVLTCCDSLFSSILIVPGFFEMFCNNIHEDKYNEWTKLQITNALFHKLPLLSISNPEILESIDFPKFLDTIFHVVGQSFVLSCTISFHVRSNEYSCLYEELTQNISATLLLFTPKQFSLIEPILWNHLLKENIWCSLMVEDVWCCILRHSPVNFRYEIFCSLTEQMEPILKCNFGKRPDILCLENLLQRMYVLLPENYKVRVIEKYPLNKMVYYWKIIGLGNLPQSHRYLMESLSICVMEMCKALKAERCTAENFTELCDGLESISTINFENNSNMKQFISEINKMWEFDLSSNELLESTLFKHFVEKLCLATSKFILQFNNEQLFLCLSQLKMLQNVDFNINICILEVLGALSSKQVELSSEQNRILSLIAELFNLLLNSADPVIQQHSLEVFYKFLKTTPHTDIIHLAVNNCDNLETLVSNFIQKNGAQLTATQREKYYKNTSLTEFKHKCIVWSLSQTHEQKFKKIKYDNTEVTKLISRIKNNVQQLRTMLANDKIPDANVTDVICAIQQLQELM